VNVLTVSLMSSCNRSCYYCPVKKWLRPLSGEQTQDDIDNNRPKVNQITNAALLSWLGAYLDPREWYIELTGGEPGLYPEIALLIAGLSGRGYNGMVKTNGSLPVPPDPRFTRVTAWHEGVKDLPPYYDQIVIIENPKDKWKDKVSYCKERGIPYHTVLFDRQYEGRKIDPAYCRINKTIKCLHISSSGQITPCSRVSPDDGCTIFKMSPPEPLDLSRRCPRCKNMNDVEMFLPGDIRQKFEEDFKKHYSNGGVIKNAG